MTDSHTQKLPIKELVLMALFTTLTIIGTMIRIPVPSAFGAPFIHLGNSVLLLSVLLLGYKKGALAGGLGFALFDFFNGFPLEAPYFFVESFIVGGAAALAWHSLSKYQSKIWAIVLTALSAGIIKLVMTFLKNIVLSYMMTGNLNVAYVSATGSLPATIVNVISTIIIVTLVYPPLKKLTRQYFK